MSHRGGGGGGGGGAGSGAGGRRRGSEDTNDERPLFERLPGSSNSSLDGSSGHGIERPGSADGVRPGAAGLRPQHLRSSAGGGGGGGSETDDDAGSSVASFRSYDYPAAVGNKAATHQRGGSTLRYYSHDEDWGGYGPTSSSHTAANNAPTDPNNGHHRRGVSSLSTSTAFYPHDATAHNHHPAASPAHPPPAPSNKGTALESLTAGGIWALLFTPYVALVLALLIDLRPHYRVATTTPFVGGITSCAANEEGPAAHNSTMPASETSHLLLHATGCLRVVNTNFSQLYSPPFRVPVQSAFLNLDAQFAPDALLTPLVAAPADSPSTAADAGEGEEEEQGDVGTGGSRRWRWWWRRRLRSRGSSKRSAPMGAAGDAGGDEPASSSSAPNATGSAIDVDEKKKQAEEARDRLGLALSARLEVPLSDGSGWRVLYQGPSVRRVLDIPDPDTAASTGATADGPRLVRASSAGGKEAEAAAAAEEEEASTTLPGSVRNTPTSFRLLAVLFDTPGVERGFPVYRVAITMEGPGAGALPQHLGFTLRHDRWAYLWGLALLRALLLALTVTYAYLWYALMWRETGWAAGGGGVCSWLPEQQYIGFLLLPALLLWQDPLSLILAFLPMPPSALLFLSDLSHTIGYQTMLLAWACVLDGLRSYETPKEVWLRSLTLQQTRTQNSHAMAFDGGAGKRAFPAVGDPYLQPRLAPTRSQGSGSGHGGGGGLWPPKHHPRGDYFGDFAFPKLLLFLPSVLVTALLCALRYPQLFFAPADVDAAAAGTTAPNGSSGGPLRHLYLIVSLLALGLLAAWYFVVLNAVVWTGRALRRQPYMRTRSQQLSYRFVAQQVFLILICKLAALVLETLRLGRLVGSHLGDIRSLWHAQLAIDSAQLPLWASSFRPLAGELLFISLTSALTALVFLPAKRWSESQSDVGGGGYPHVALEAELPARQKQWATSTPPTRMHARRGGAASNGGSKGPPVFCLETACWLMEAAWQSYYDPDGRFHPAPASDAVTPGKMALGNLGLELVAYIHDPLTDTHAILARGRHALVLAFRGTLSSRNMLTDLKMGQVPLPDMRLGGSSRQRRRRGDGEEEGRSLLGGGGSGIGGIFSPGTPPPPPHSSAEGSGRYGSTGALDRLSAASPGSGLRTSSAGDLRRLGGGDGSEDRYRRRASTPPQQPNTGSSRARQRPAASDAAAFVPASPVALPWAGPADQRRASGASPAPGVARGRSPAASHNQRTRSASADYGEGRRRWSLGSSGDEEEEGWDEEAEEALLQGLFDTHASPTSSVLGCGPSCRRSLARLPALRHTLPHVHAGFWGAYTGVRAQLMVAIKRALDAQYAPVLCTGHSLGGALVMLAAYDITVNFPRLPHPVQVYTQGSPRLGNLAFASLYDTTVPATFRVVVDGDIIPGMPKMLGLYRHCGIEVLVDADNGGNLIVQPSAVEKWLLMRHRTSTNNHSLTAYRDCMEACFDPDDLVLYLPKVLGQDQRTSADDDLPEWLLGSRRSTHLL